MLHLLSPVIPGPLGRAARVMTAALLLTVVAVVALTLLGATDAMAWMPSSGEPQQCYLDESDRWICN